MTVSQAALVVLSDSFASGWQVTVDDQPARIYRANAVYRGVAVGAGRHRLAFSYRPADVRWGGVGAVATLLACLAGCWWWRRGRAVSCQPSAVSGAGD